MRSSPTSGPRAWMAMPLVSESLSTRRVVQEGAERLRALGVAHARYEAEWLLGRLVGLKPLEVYLGDVPLPAEAVQRFFSQIEARASGVPLQYLLGEAEFFGERFAVMPGVFIPRPETEAIVEHALQALRLLEAGLARPLRVLDLGTGSGCIAVTVARALPTCVVVGVELSWRALCVAQQNVLRHGLASRVQLIQGNWLEALRGEWDAMVSNPPYVPSAQIDHLPLDVRQEPRVSLDGGEDGLRDLLCLLAQAPRVLRPNGIVMLECGEDQAARLVDEAAMTGWVHQARALHDLAGRPRGVMITRAAS